MSVPILLIDDDKRLADLLKKYMDGHGYTLSVANNAHEGLRLLRGHEFEAVLLDIMLPDGDGLEVCKKIRMESSIPILMLTARGADEDKIIGLELGADDYIAKPFNPRELVARVKAVLRRKGATKWEGDLALIEFPDFQLNPSNQKLIVRGNEIELTSAEFRLLKILCSNPGRVFTRERLMDLVQNRDFDGIDRSIDVHISRLRNKIEVDPKKPRWIKTVWGSGYRFEPSTT
jgi:two-component system OmpR family response regulator/two-component system phosphate regulon response regulator OmpR